MREGLMRSGKGFTRVEISIVGGGVLLIAGIAIPNLLRARLSASEAAATGALRTLVSSQIAYRATHSQYANLSQLAEEYPPYIDSVLATGNKQSFTFLISGITSNQFYVTATPQALSQGHTFYADEDGIVCRS